MRIGPVRGRAVEQDGSIRLNLGRSYAPPFSPLWAPILVAVREACQRVQEAVGETR
jgi:hypothetical protein